MDSSVGDEEEDHNTGIVNSSSTSSAIISNAVPPSSSIPEVALGYEEIYSRFINGKLIYQPNPNSDEGKIEMKIKDLSDPLNGTFNLSECGDAGEYLTIATGYYKVGDTSNPSSGLEMRICKA